MQKATEPFILEARVQVLPLVTESWQGNLKRKSFFQAKTNNKNNRKSCLKEQVWGKCLGQMICDTLERNWLTYFYVSVNYTPLLMLSRYACHCVKWCVLFQSVRIPLSWDVAIRRVLTVSDSKSLRCWNRLLSSTYSV